MFQHVVRLQNVWRCQFHAIEIAAREFQVAVLAVRHQQRRLRVIQLAKHFDKRLRFVRFKRPGIHNRQLLLREFCRKRRPQRAKQHLLWQGVAVIARPWSVNRAAMTPERRPDRADARAPCALLLPELAARAADFAFFLDLVRAPAQPPQIPPRSFVQQVLIHLRAKDRVRQLDLADLLATQIDYINDRHELCSFSIQNVTAYFAFLALRMKIYVPLGPGTDPRTSSRFSSVSIFTTFKFFAVTFWFPMWPGKCWFFQTRDGNELPPIPPGAR